jgi:hypothetical protein
MTDAIAERIDGLSKDQGKDKNTSEMSCTKRIMAGGMEGTGGIIVTKDSTIETARRVTTGTTLKDAMFQLSSAVSRLQEERGDEAVHEARSAPKPRAQSLSKKRSQSRKLRRKSDGVGSLNPNRFLQSTKSN